MLLKHNMIKEPFCAKKGLENCEILVIVSAELLKRLNERIAVI